jgi:hypothetical protein
MDSSPSGGHHDSRRGHNSVSGGVGPKQPLLGYTQCKRILGMWFSFILYHPQFAKQVNVFYHHYHQARHQYKMLPNVVVELVALLFFVFGSFVAHISNLRSFVLMRFFVLFLCLSLSLSLSPCKFRDITLYWLRHLLSRLLSLH